MKTTSLNNRHKFMHSTGTNNTESLCKKVQNENNKKERN